MSETQKTVTFGIVALVLLGLAVATQPKVSRDVAQVFDDTGEPFFPALTDAKTPKALEVIEFNDELSTVKPFKVQWKDNKWTIPSHHDYPADAERRVYESALSLIGLRKDSIVSNSKADHAELGVVDPFQTGDVPSKGWGTRVKLSDEAGNVVTDLIFGKDVEGKPGFKYVRIPDKDRVYAVKADDVKLSTKFADWIDKDLLELDSFDLSKVTLKNYHIDLQKGPIDEGTLVLSKGAENKWTLEGLTEAEELVEDKASTLRNAIADLEIVGVRQKPPGMKPDLRAPEGLELALSMQSRGFYLLKNGELASNDGEVLAETEDGLVYTLRFGEKIVGKGDEVTAGSKKEEEKPVAKEADPKEAKADAKKDADKKDGDAKDEKKAEEKKDGIQENRFLLVSVAFNEAKFPPIPDATPATPAQDQKPAEKTAPAKETKDARESTKDVKESGSGNPDEEEQDEQPPAKEQPKAEAQSAPEAKKVESVEARKEQPKAEEKGAPAKTEEKKAEATKPADAKTETKPAEKAEAKPAEDAEAAKKKAEADKKQQEDELKRKREERERKITDGKKKAEELTNRYAQWYYVINDEAFKKIRLNRAELVKPKEKKDETKAEPGKAAAESPSPAKTVPAPAKGEAKDAKPEPKDSPKAEAKPEPSKSDAKSEPAKGEGKPADEKAAVKPADSKTAPKAPAKEAVPAKDSKAKPAKDQ